MTKARRETVLVAMSGGVDSSMAASFLQQRGYAATGITFRLWRLPGAKDSSAAIERAQVVCQKLNIPHLVVDLREEFEASIVNSFVEAYLSGITPNPCVFCNRVIKWTHLRKIADERGIHYIATGHYARVIFNSAVGRFQLLKAVDGRKDQSYALWQLRQTDLARTIFPLGERTKPEIKRLAREAGLFSEDVDESQDICFIPDNDYRRFLIEYAPERIQAIGDGEIVDETGQVVGRHSGFYNFTIGQRKGFKRGFKERMYVKLLDAEHNRVIITNRDGLRVKGLIIKQANFVSQPESKEWEGDVKIRYGSVGVPCRGRYLASGIYEILFMTPQHAVCPGQSAVVYQGEQVLLGGIIQAALD